MAGFSPTGGMNVGRQLRSAAPLADGRVLVAGGRDDQGSPLITAEIYNPESGHWTPTGSLNAAHDHALLVGLADGAAITGGDLPDHDTLLELWDTASGEWTKTVMPPFLSRVEGAWQAGDHLLVLCTPETALAPMEFRSIDLTDGQVAALPSPTIARFGSLTCRLADGRILLASGASSGIGTGGAPVEFLTRECEVYDVAAGTWSPVGDLRVPHRSLDRGAQCLVALPDGGALMVSGSNEGGPTAYTDVVERWSLGTGVWHTGAPLTELRDAHTTTVLSDASVLVVGGEGPAGVRSDCQIYDVAADSWSSADDLIRPRLGHVSVPLTDGSVLVIDGAGDGTCELYS
jgi:Galactose oxidase, central domain